MKKIYTIILLAILFGNANAQGPNWVWAKNQTSGGTGDDFTRVAVDPSGNSFSAGYFGSASITFGTTTLTNAGVGGTQDISLVKYDPAGNVLWAKSVGGTSSESPLGVATDASGNCFITGIYSSNSITFGTTTLTNSGSYDIFIAKYDPLGNVLWAKKAGGTGDDESNSIVVDASGNSYIVGYITGTAMFGSTTLVSAGNYIDMFITKYDQSGNVVWAKNAGGSASLEDAHAVAVDALGNLAVTGYYYGGNPTFGTTILNINSGVTDLFVVKFDALGNVIWATESSGNTAHDNPRSIITDPSNNIYITGYFDSPSLVFGTTTLTNAGSYDGYIIKYDPSGNVLWAKNVGGTGDERGRAIITDASGNSYTAGYFGSSSITLGSTTLTLSGTSSPFIAKYDPAGNAVWAKSAGGNGDNRIISISSNSTGQICVSGYFTGSAVFGSNTINDFGSIDMFVAKLSGLTGENDLTTENSLLVFPNPSTGVFAFDSQISIGEITIYNFMGEKVLEQKIVSEKSEIDLSDKSKGIYFYQIISESKNVTTGKLIVQ